MQAFVGRVAAILGMAALVGVAASAPSGAEDSGSSAAIEAPVFAPLVPTEPGSGEGLTIGYISLGESIAYIHTVTKGIEENAKIAGAKADRLRFKARRGHGASVRPELQDPARRRNSQFPGSRGRRPEDLRGGAGCPGDRDRYQSEALHDLVPGRQQRRRRPDHRQGRRRGLQGDERMQVRCDVHRRRDRIRVGHRPAP